MFRIRWPLIVLVDMDFLGLLSFAYRWDTSITAGIENAFLGCGLFIVQLPLCAVGARAAARADKRDYVRLYVGHAVLTVLFCAFVNIDW